MAKKVEVVIEEPTAEEEETSRFVDVTRKVLLASIGAMVLAQ